MPRGSQSIKSRGSKISSSQKSKKSSQKQAISGEGYKKSKRKDLPITNPEQSKTNERRTDISKLSGGGAITPTHSFSSNRKPPTTAKTSHNKLVAGPAKICLKSQNSSGKYFCRS